MKEVFLNEDNAVVDKKGQPLTIYHDGAINKQKSTTVNGDGKEKKSFLCGPSFIEEKASSTENNKSVEYRNFLLRYLAMRQNGNLNLPPLIDDPRNIMQRAIKAPNIFGEENMPSKKLITHLPILTFEMDKSSSHELSRKDFGMLIGLLGKDKASLFYDGKAKFYRNLQEIELSQGLALRGKLNKDVTAGFNAFTDIRFCGDNHKYQWYSLGFEVLHDVFELRNNVYYSNLYGRILGVTKYTLKDGMETINEMKVIEKMPANGYDFEAGLKLKTFGIFGSIYHFESPYSSDNNLHNQHDGFRVRGEFKLPLNKKFTLNVKPEFQRDKRRGDSFSIALEFVAPLRSQSKLVSHIKRDNDIVLVESEHTYHIEEASLLSSDERKDPIDRIVNLGEKRISLAGKGLVDGADSRANNVPAAASEGQRSRVRVQRSLAGGGGSTTGQGSESAEVATVTPGAGDTTNTATAPVTQGNTQNNAPGSAGTGNQGAATGSGTGTGPGGAGTPSSGSTAGVGVTGGGTGTDSAGTTTVQTESTTQTGNTSAEGSPSSTSSTNSASSKGGVSSGKTVGTGETVTVSGGKSNTTASGGESTKTVTTTSGDGDTEDDDEEDSTVPAAEVIADAAEEDLYKYSRESSDVLYYVPSDVTTEFQMPKPIRPVKGGRSNSMVCGIFAGAGAYMESVVTMKNGDQRTIYHQLGDYDKSAGAREQGLSTLSFSNINGDEDVSGVNILLFNHLKLKNLPSKINIDMKIFDSQVHLTRPVQSSCFFNAQNTLFIIDEDFRFDKKRPFYVFKDFYTTHSLLQEYRFNNVELIVPYKYHNSSVMRVFGSDYHSALKVDLSGTFGIYTYLDAKDQNNNTQVALHPRIAVPPSYNVDERYKVNENWENFIHRIKIPETSIFTTKESGSKAAAEADENKRLAWLKNNWLFKWFYPS